MDSLLEAFEELEADFTELVEFFEEEVVVAFELVRVVVFRLDDDFRL